jgi:molybdenum cofactor cytidylyltransferase
MGRLKPLLAWHGLKLVEYQVANLVAGGATEVTVVLGHRYEEVVPHVRGPGVGYVVNPHYRDGRSTSIKAGVARVQPDAEAIVVLGVDQPRPSEIVAKVLEAHLAAGALITSPRHEGRGGHPIVFSSALRGELEAITENDQGLRQVFDVHGGEVNELEIDDPIIQLDLNTPEAYEQARAHYDA